MILEKDELVRIVEALLFAGEKPLSAEDLSAAFGADKPDDAQIGGALAELAERFRQEDRGIQLVEVAGGFQFVTNPRLSEYLKKFYEERDKKKLPQATLETLSIIAYKQPVTRAEIEFIRGVNVDGAVKSLLDKGLVRITGRKEAPGRPMLYGTTREFLEHFGLKSLEELPALAEFNAKDLDARLLPPELKETAQGPAEIAGDERNGENT